MILGIELRPGDVIRHDVVLQIGEIDGVGRSHGGDALDVTRPDVSHSVDEKYYQTSRSSPPATSASPSRCSRCSPATFPCARTATRCSGEASSTPASTGARRRATENFFDGGAFGYASGHQGSQESAPPVEAIQEVTVISTTYSAQYGHTSGGFIEYTSKSGTNRFHGSAYGYLANDALNSKGFFKAAQDSARQQELGRRRSAGPSSRTRPSSSSTPTGRGSARAPARASATRRRSTPSRRGDFSALLTGTQIGVDALGRPLFEGQIFNPATTRLVNGVPCATPIRATSSRSTIPCGAGRRAILRAYRASRPPGPVEQRGRQPGGQPDLGPGRAQPPPPPGPHFLAQVQGDVQRLLQQPPVGPELRRRPGLHRRRTTR